MVRRPVVRLGEAFEIVLGVRVGARFPLLQEEEVSPPSEEAALLLRLHSALPLGGPDLTSSEQRWVRLATALSDADAAAARHFIVCRARRIWGRLGVRLRDSHWAQQFRRENLVPVRVLTYIRRWIRKR